MHKLVFKDGTELIVRVLAKALNVLICRDTTQRFLLVSRFALENGKEIFKLPKDELYD